MKKLLRNFKEYFIHHKDLRVYKKRIREIENELWMWAEFIKPRNTSISFSLRNYKSLFFKKTLVAVQVILKPSCFRYDAFGYILAFKNVDQIDHSDIFYKKSLIKYERFFIQRSYSKTDKRKIIISCPLPYEKFLKNRVSYLMDQLNMYRIEYDFRKYWFKNKEFKFTYDNKKTPSSSNS